MNYDEQELLLFVDFSYYVDFSNSKVCDLLLCPSGEETFSVQHASIRSRTIQWQRFLKTRKGAYTLANRTTREL